MKRVTDAVGSFVREEQRTVAFLALSIVVMVGSQLATGDSEMALWLMLGILAGDHFALTHRVENMEREQD